MPDLYHIAKQYYIPILIVLISKFITLVIITGISASLVNSRTSFGVWELWNVWDSPHYLSIARIGYQTSGDEANFIVFYPLFPLIIKFFHLIPTISYLVSAYLVSFIASMLLAISFYKLVLTDYSKQVASFAVVMLFIFPTSFFLHIPYTESLFILLSVAAFYFVRRSFWLAFILVGFATLTRVTGLALIPAILTEIFIYNKENFRNRSIYRKLSILFFGVTICLSGFLLYLFLNFKIFGDPLHFTLVEKQNWYTNFNVFGQGLVSAYKSIFWRVGLEKIMLGYGQIIAFALGLVMSIYVLAKIRVSYGVYMLFALWLSSVMSFWLSMPRYVLSLFPMFIVLALMAENKLFRYIWILSSLILMIVTGLIFVKYGPVF